MSIDFNILDFIDIIFIVLIPVAVMVLVTYWLRQQNRSARMIQMLWGVFSLIVVVGLTCLLIGIQSVRSYWMNYFGEIAAACSIIVSELDHWKVQTGDENVFSDWSAPITPVDAKLSAPGDSEHSEKDTATYTPGSKLSVPKMFVATRSNGNQVELAWQAVSGATTYRVQWGKIDAVTGESVDQWEDEDWENVYSGALLRCIVPDTDLAHVFRIRAETGTPEDDPAYQRLLKACDRAAMASPSESIASIYTMRPIDEDFAMFIICPETDVNRNGIFEPNERPAPIGERYDNTPLMRYVFANHTLSVNTIPIKDDWGIWLTAFHPLFDPEGNFDGVVGVDFDYSLWRNNLTRAKIWPYSFFFILNLLFFVSIFLIVKNHLSAEAMKLYTEKLQDTVGQLTEAKKAADAAARAKSHFLANMSHEIRTPMNAILGFANIMGRKLMQRCLPEEKNECRESIDLITNSGNDLLTIINDILDFSKVESDQIEVESIPVSLHKIMESIHTIMQDRLDDKQGVRLEITDEGGVPEYILSDPTRLRQILSNLIGNAIKFTERGAVAVRYGVKPRGNDIANDASRVPLYVEIKDTGIGMSEEQLARLFLPFSQADSSLTRRFGGTGLGLSISKRLANLLGGDIIVSSKESVGSTFTLLLDARIPNENELKVIASQKANAAELDSSAGINEVTAKPLVGYRILVVEDGRVNQIVLSTQLTDAGSQVTLAENGKIAIDTIQKNVAAGTPFDIVLMDMQMPIMDGYEATQHLRNLGYDRPIVAITAHSLSGDCEKTLKIGCDAYLSKPVDRGQLLQTILRFEKNDKTV